MKNKFKAFTLAEILVTLTVIGIVAAYTIPALVTAIRNQDTVTRLKKLNSVLAQSALQIQTDGANMAALFDGVDYGTPANYFVAKMIYLKKGEGSFPDTVYKYLDGTPWTTIAATPYTALLNDGTMLDFINYGTSCTTNNGGSVFPGGPEHLCGYILADINGAKSPNTIGRDTFLFWVTKTSVIPVGFSGWDDCGTGTNLGQTCAYKVLMENVINY